MTGFEPWISSVGTDRTTNCATIIAQFPFFVWLSIFNDQLLWSICLEHSTAH